ncbi:MAG TPA: hemerythrin domain-containing protein [Terracidiphilus sp.]|nr:hemerythrin domain-containing protein [Terracidiphilus sp.]
MADGATHASAIAGVQAMEDQHGILVDSLNTLRQQLRHGNGAARLTEQIARLAEFTDLHFGCEESLLRRHGYPELDLHRKAHQELINQIKVVLQRAEEGEDPELEHALMTIRVQYLDHVEKLDRAYSDWLQTRGVS